MKYNPAIVTAFYREHGIPTPAYEFQFHPDRKWRFDLAWYLSEHHCLLAIEVQGGIWTGGRHNRGAAMLKEWEKLNAAAVMGWRVLYFQPRDLCLKATADVIREALGL